MLLSNSTERKGDRQRKKEVCSTLSGFKLLGSISSMTWEEQCQNCFCSELYALWFKKKLLKIIIIKLHSLYFFKYIILSVSFLFVVVVAGMCHVTVPLIENSQ